MKTLDCQVELYTSSIDCLAALMSNPNRSEQFCIVTDISLEAGADGLLLLDNLKDKGFNFVSIAMTGFASIENAIAATKKGVYHYLTKPFELENLQKLVINAISDKLGVKVNPLNTSDNSFGKLKGKTFKNVKIEAPTEDDIFCGMIGRSKEMKQVFERIQKVALTESTVLITGPSGTGKELVAGAIHNLSSRNRNNKVSVNCGAIPKDLLESELFGHIKGSFTGAISNRKGRFELANDGSIFLDEIGDMPLLLQVKLLRVLQNRTIEPVGSTEPISIDTRVIAATHRNLETMVEEGKFREDLFYSCLLYTSPSPRDKRQSRMPSSA